MNKKINVYLLYMIVFLQGFVFYGSIATIYRQARGLSMYEIFIIESISWVLMIVFEVPWGWFADRFGYKKTLVISNFIFFISKIVFFKAAAFPMFLLERILLSVCLSGLSGCDAALLYLSSDKAENSERIFARYSSCSTTGFLLAALISPIIINISIEATAFYTIIPYGIASIVALFLVDVKREALTKPSIKESLKIVVKNKSFILFVISTALIAEVVHTVTVFLNQIQYIRSGIDIKYFGILLALAQVIKLITVKSYKLSDKFGKLKSITGLYLIIFISCIGLIFTHMPIMSILLICLIGGSMSLVEPMSIDLQNKSIITEDRATILSIYSMCSSMISAIVNPFIGLSSDASIQTGLATCAIVCIAAFVCIFLYAKNINCSEPYYDAKI